MSTLVGFEHLVDSTTTIFLQELQRRFADKHTVCDFGRWLQFYSFDVIGELTFSKRLGFIEHGVDVEGIIASNDSFLDYANVVISLVRLHDSMSNLFLPIYTDRPTPSPGQTLIEESHSTLGK